MVIGLLVVLGVDLVVIVVVAAIVVSRRRSVRHRPDVFAGAVRVKAGEVDGLRGTWSRGFGRWVGTAFVWTKAPLLFRTTVVAGDALLSSRPANPGEVKRLGDHPVVCTVRMGDATVEIAAARTDAEPLRGPFDDSTTVQAVGPGPHGVTDATQEGDRDGELRGGGAVSDDGRAPVRDRTGGARSAPQGGA